MPFDEEPEVEIEKKIGVRKVSTVKSMFDKSEVESKPTYQTFEKKVEEINKRSNDYKTRAAELATSFKKIITDKTLPQNKNLFSEEVEKEVLSKMISLAVEINTDEDEQEGMGSLGWITLLLKVVISYRDRMNVLEYNLVQLQKQLDESKRKINILSSSQGIDLEKQSK